MAQSTRAIHIPLHANVVFVRGFNAVEGFFAKLTKRRLKRGVFGRRSAGRHQSLRRRTQYQAEALHLDR
jgi:hypothetical protein